MANIQGLSPPHRIRISGRHNVETDVLAVSGYVLAEPIPRLPRGQVRRLIGEVQQQPQLETGIRDGELYVAPGRLASRVLQALVLIDIEHAPDLVVPQV